MNAPTFDTWMKAVDKIIQKRLGVCAADLPDQCYSAYHDEGLTPNDAAEIIIDEMYEESGYTQEFDEYSDADPGL